MALRGRIRRHMSTNGDPAGMPSSARKLSLRSAVLRPLGALAVVAALTACGDPVSIALSGASVISVVETGKTISDHAMSVATGQDCSIQHTFAGMSWCQSQEEEMPDPSANLVCYRSIAEVTCYPRYNPNETASRRTQ